MCVSEPCLISGLQKCHFYFCATSRNAHNRSLGKWRHQRIRFLGPICFPKNISTWNLACQMSRHGSTTYGTRFWKLRKGFWKMFYNTFSFLHFGYKTIMFRKIPDSHFKELFILRLLVLCICILLTIAIFGDFSNIYQFPTKNDMTFGHLHQYNSKSSRENFQKIV